MSRTRKNFELIKGALFLLDLMFVHSATMQYRQYHSALQKSTSFYFHRRHSVACTFYQSQPIRYPLGFVGAQFFLGARMATAGRNLKVHFANHFHNFSFHLFMITVFPLFFPLSKGSQQNIVVIILGKRAKGFREVRNGKLKKTA